MPPVGAIFEKQELPSLAESSSFVHYCVWLPSLGILFLVPFRFFDQEAARFRPQVHTSSYEDPVSEKCPGTHCICSTVVKATSQLLKIAIDARTPCQASQMRSCSFLLTCELFTESQIHPSLVPFCVPLLA
eukprot:2657636-Amphidinium_carterae.1